MPFLSDARHARRFVESPRQHEVLSHVEVLVTALLVTSIPEGMKMRMLKHALWEVAVATGNFHSRYRTEAVRRRSGLTIQREHVHKRHLLIRNLLRRAPAIPTLVRRAFCCIVTKDEHSILHAVPPNLDGWARYAAAGIVVYDMVDDLPLTFAEESAERPLVGDAPPGTLVSAW
jgi:hypothetical protein